MNIRDQSTHDDLAEDSILSLERGFNLSSSVASSRNPQQTKIRKELIRDFKTIDSTQSRTSAYKLDKKWHASRKIATQACARLRINSEDNVRKESSRSPDQYIKQIVINNMSSAYKPIKRYLKGKLNNESLHSSDAGSPR